MIANDQARIDAKLSHASYDEVALPTGYQVVQDSSGHPLVIHNPNTGFHVEIYQKIGTNEYTVAFTGTQPQTSQDFVADLALGIPQWTKNASAVFAAINTLPGATKITFTGHSLGGALAQYAAYDYVNGHISHPPVDLVTFNGLGGISGLQQMYGSTSSYRRFPNQRREFLYELRRPRSRFSAKVGWRLLGREYISTQSLSLGLGLVDIHTGPEAWLAFENVTIPATATAVQYLNIPAAQYIAALYAYLGDDGKITNLEGWFRTAGGILVALTTAPQSQIDQLVNALIPNGAILQATPSLYKAVVGLLGIGVIVEANYIQMLNQGEELLINAGRWFIELPMTPTIWPLKPVQVRSPA